MDRHIYLPKRIAQARLPLLGRVALFRDEGEGKMASGLIVGTHLGAQLIRDGKVVEKRDLGSGVITIGFVNAMVADAVAGTSVVPILARYKYHDSGTGTTAATDGDTVLQTQAGPATRATATLSNAQSATTGNHAAILQQVATISYAASLAITEWGNFDQAAQGGNLGDHRIFAAFNVVSGDGIQFTWQCTIPSNN